MDRNVVFDPIGADGLYRQTPFGTEIYGASRSVPVGITCGAKRYGG